MNPLITDRDRYMSIVASELLRPGVSSLQEAEKKSIATLSQVLGRTISLEEQAVLTKAIDPWRGSDDVVAQRRIAEQFLTYVGSMSGVSGNDWREHLHAQLKRAVASAPELGQSAVKNQATSMACAYERAMTMIAEVAMEDLTAPRRRPAVVKKEMIEAVDLAPLLELMKSESPLAAAMIGAQVKRFAENKGKEWFSPEATILLERIEAQASSVSREDRGMAMRYLAVFDLVSASPRSALTRAQVDDLKSALAALPAGERSEVEDALRARYRGNTLVEAIFPEESKQGRLGAISAQLELFALPRALPAGHAHARQGGDAVDVTKIGGRDAQLILSMIADLPAGEQPDAKKLVLDKLFTASGGPKASVSFRDDAQWLLLTGLGWVPPKRPEAGAKV